jgi:hypothetical protein
MEMKDFLGREIEVGHMLVYPVRRGSSMQLKKIRVSDLTDDVIHGVNDIGRGVWLHKPDRSVIVTERCEYCQHDPTKSEG